MNWRRIFRVRFTSRFKVVRRRVLVGPVNEITFVLGFCRRRIARLSCEFLELAGRIQLFVQRSWRDSAIQSTCLHVSVLSISKNGACDAAYRYPARNRDTVAIVLQESETARTLDGDRSGATTASNVRTCSCTHWRRFLLFDSE